MFREELSHRSKAQVDGKDLGRIDQGRQRNPQRLREGTPKRFTSRLADLRVRTARGARACSESASNTRPARASPSDGKVVMESTTRILPNNSGS